MLEYVYKNAEQFKVVCTSLVSLSFVEWLQTLYIDIITDLMQLLIALVTFIYLILKAISVKIDIKNKQKDAKS